MLKVLLNNPKYIIAKFLRVSVKSMIINANRISIDFNDTDYAKGLGVSVQGAREGSVSGVGIEYTKDCAVQKDMEESIVYTGAEKNRKSIVDEVVQHLPGEEFDPAEFISKSMNGEDAAEIEEDGTILEEYVASSLERAIERVKSQRHERNEAIEQQVEDGAKKREYFDEIEQRIMDAAQMASSVKGMSDASVKYFLENDLRFSPADIQNSSAVSGASTYMDDRASFDEMKQQVENIIENSGMAVDEKNMDTAKQLYENDIPVTGENIQAYQVLEELKDVPPDVLADRIMDQVMDGITPEYADLTAISREEAGRRLADLKRVDDAALRRTFRTEADFITAKRQLEEIRLTMTIDAARVMENKGIHLDVENLVEIVDELKRMEQEAGLNLLVEAGVADSSENIETVVKTMHARADILAAPAAVYAKTIGTAKSDTIQDIAEAGNTLRIRMEEAAQSYEAVGTEVRKDLGDSISKAFANVDDILADLELEQTAANQRAVRILAYNRMPLTKENIVSMKEYDEQVTSLVKSLKPQVVAELIRRQENPLEMNLDELGEKVAKISEEIYSEDISFRKFIWKLDHHGDISSEERKSMIGIYRLLDKVEKSDGAVIGQVVKEGKELSFSSLLSAVRSRKSQGMDRKIDDDFGGLGEVITSGESISDQISAGFAGSVVSKLQKALSPTVLENGKESVMERPLEVLLDECNYRSEATEENMRYYDEVAAEIRQLAAEGDSQIMECLKELELPDSLLNIHIMKSYLEQGGKAFLKLYSKEESDRLIDSFDKPEVLWKNFEEMDEEHKEELEAKENSENISYAEIKEIALMAGSISFYRQMRSFQKYEVPIVTEHGVTACSVTVRQGKESEKGTVEISMDSSRFGVVHATFKVTQEQVSGFITSEEEDSLEMSRELIDRFEKDLEMNGFTMDGENFAKGRRNSFHSGNKANETAANDRLYLVAKLFIQNVQRKEDEK